MKKEIREIITKSGKKIYRVTTSDERWYGTDIMNQETGLPDKIVWLPSVTWIKSYYYTSPYLIKWIAAKGMTESERIKKEAGTRGDKIHQATEILDNQGQIALNEKILNKEKGEMEELTGEEIEAIQSYADFLKDYQPEIISNEMTIFADKYAGTLDRIYRIKDEVWIIDIKTSKAVHKDMILQVSAYSHANIDYKALGITDEEWKNRKLAILQLGYARNSKKYKFTEIPDRYDLFEIAYKVWAEENKGVSPKQREFPLIIKSPLKVVEEKKKKEKK